MSSGDSMSSSRLSQFGLYRTIDARTEEFLKLSRKRQIRQGCACAAVSTAVTVTVVVSILFLYGYGIGAAPGAARRPPAWLRLLNHSGALEQRLQDSIKLDRAAMNLLPVFFDNILEQDSSSPKYETNTATELTFVKDTFSGTNMMAKIPSSRLFAIQYKTFPIVYIHSPRNTDNFMKLRKTREYERIMSYIEKMINEKVAFGSSRSVRNQPSVETEKMSKSILTTPATPKSSQIRKKSKIINLNSQNYPHIYKSPIIKLNNTKATKTKHNCKCNKQFGVLLKKLMKCFQGLSEDIVEQPYATTSNKNVSKMCVENTEKPKIRKTITSTVRPITRTTATPKYYDISRTTTESFNIADNFFQKMLQFNRTKLKTKEILDQFSPIYIMNGNEKPKNNIFQSNKAGLKLSKQNPQDFALRKLENKVEEKKHTTTSTTTSTTTKYTTTTSSSATTTSSPSTKYEDIYQEILFPEGNVFEITKYPEQPLKIDSAYSLYPRNYKRKSENQNASDTKTYHEKINQVTANNYNHEIKTGTTSKYPKISPEEYVIEQFLQKHNIMKPIEPKYLEYNKSIKNNENNIAKVTDISNIKLLQPHRKNIYRNSSPQMKKKKPFTKIIEDKQPLPRQCNDETTKINIQNMDLQFPPIKTSTVSTSTSSSQEYDNKHIDFTKTQVKILPEVAVHSIIKDIKQVNTLKENLQLPRTPQFLTTTETTTSTSTVPPAPILVVEKDSVLNPLQTFTKNKLMPHVVTPATIQEVKQFQTSKELEKTFMLNNSSEDIWNDFEIDKTPIFDNTHSDDNVLTTSPSDTNFTDILTTTERVDSKNAVKSKIILTDYSSEISKLFTSSDEISKTGNDHENLFQSAIPIGRKSYLEISRGDWKQIEPHIDDANLIYDAFDEVR